MMRVTVEKAGRISILRCEGRLRFGEPLEHVRDAVLCEANNIVRVDLSGVSSIDAAGLGLLASLCRLAYAAGIDFCLVNPSSRVQELLELVRLDFAILVSPSVESVPLQENKGPIQTRPSAA